MKKTIQMLPDSEQERAVYALMSRCGFKEVERLVVGGYQSPVMLAVTFQFDQIYWERYETAFYVEIPQPTPARENRLFSNYYSLQCLEGKKCQNVKEFQSYLASLKTNKIEVQHF